METKKVDYDIDLGKVKLYPITKFVDDRGSFLNIDLKELDIITDDLWLIIETLPNEFKRSYIISNHRSGVVRGFHGHVHEGKLFYALAGSFKFIIMDLNRLQWKEYVISSEVPMVLWVPPGYYNGFTSLTDKNLLICFSTSTMKESIKDDIRLDYDVLGEDVWEIKHR